MSKITVRNGHATKSFVSITASPPSAATRCPGPVAPGATCDVERGTGATGSTYEGDRGQSGTRDAARGPGTFQVSVEWADGTRSTPQTVTLPASGDASCTAT